MRMWRKIVILLMLMVLIAGLGIALYPYINGWITDEQELYAIAKEVMAREDLKYCPHGRPICISLSKKQVEKQFKRT